MHVIENVLLANSIGCLHAEQYTIHVMFVVLVCSMRITRYLQIAFYAMSALQSKLSNL